MGFGLCGATHAWHGRGLDFLRAPEARLALSLLLGLLLGVERERRQAHNGHRSIAGLRTFGLVAFLGGLARYLDVPFAVLGLGLVVGAMVVVGYAVDPDRHRDKGLTTEVALVLAYVLGALALTAPAVAGASAIGVTLLLHLRTTLHRFVRDAIRDDELHDGLMLLVFAFVALPLVPDVDVGPFDAVNPQRIARLMLVITLISSAGYVAQRVLGARYGLVASGLASGFVSSSATIAALGLRAKQDPTILRASVAGAVSSSIATVTQYMVIIAAIDVGLVVPLAFPLGLALAAAVAIALLFARRARGEGQAGEPPGGRAFQVLPALVVGGGSAIVAVAAAALDSQVGGSGIVIVSSVSGFVDAHATAGSVATLHHGGHLEARVAVLAVLAALSTNSVTKIVMAFLSGPPPYALRVALGVIAIAAAAWGGFALASLV